MSLLNNPLGQYEERTAKLKVDVPQLEAIISKSWGKEDELKQLKSDLAALDRKITAALAPKKEEQDGEEVKRDEQPQHVEAPAQSAGTKESMVAEPLSQYVNSFSNKDPTDGTQIVAPFVIQRAIGHR